MYVCHWYADPLDCVTILLFTVTGNLALKYAKVAILVSHQSSSRRYFVIDLFFEWDCRPSCMVGYSEFWRADVPHQIR